jgi:hypothetical protein
VTKISKVIVLRAVTEPFEQDSFQFDRFHLQRDELQENEDDKFQLWRKALKRPYLELSSYKIKPYSSKSPS